MALDWMVQDHGFVQTYSVCIANEPYSVLVTISPWAFESNAKTCNNVRTNRQLTTYNSASSPRKQRQKTFEAALVIIPTVRS